MTSARSTLLAASMALLCAAPLAGAQESDGAPQDWETPRTAYGQPDFQGIWTNATITPLQRPEKFGDRLIISDAEATEIEGAEAAYNAKADAPSDLSEPAAYTCRSGSGPTCGYNNFWIDRGSKVVRFDGQPRSSLIVDPANGRMPALTPQRQKEIGGLMRRRRQNFDGPEARPLGERCLLAFGSSSGPPMLPVLYNNHYRIVQNQDTVVILVEMVHDARIIRLGGEHVPSAVRKWMGDSIGHWDADTLVVETTNFTRWEGFRGATPDMKVTERFTRIGPDKIKYRFTIEDPEAFTQPWSGEIAFHRTDEAIYEYACHEGNYALPGVLAGARKEEQEKAGAAAAGR